MRRRVLDAARRGISVAAVCFSLCAHGRLSKTKVVDELCAAIRNEFVEAAPRHFSGPDPWVQLDALPRAYAGAALASVYKEGARIRWVVLEMTGPSNAWFETTDYFFDETGTVKKRERLLDQTTANIRIEESEYFERGKIIKTSYRHSPLRSGSGAEENWDMFHDPNAPEYTSTGDLPVLFLKTESSDLSGLVGLLGLCTRCY